MAKKPMTLRDFGQHIGRELRVETDGPWPRCYFPGVMFAAPEGQSDVDISIIGCGPNQQRMLQDFLSKIRGKVARVYQAGRRTEYRVPRSLHQ